MFSAIYIKIEAEPDQLVQYFAYLHFWFFILPSFDLLIFKIQIFSRPLFS